MMNASYSRRRALRARPQALVLTSRDLEILSFIGLCGYASSTQLAREFFPGMDRCRRRLRQLFDARLVAITLASSTKPNLVSLTKRGLSVVIARDPALDGRVRLAGAIRLAGVDHHLAVVDARLYSVALGAANGTSLLRWSNAGGDLHRELGVSAWHLAPDGIAEFASTSGSSFVGVEVDCGSESHATLADKLEKYLVASTESGISALWFIVCAGPERERRIHQLVVESGLSRFVCVINHARICARPLIEPSPLELPPPSSGLHASR